MNSNDRGSRPVPPEGYRAFVSPDQTYGTQRYAQPLPKNRPTFAAAPPIAEAASGQTDDVLASANPITRKPRHDMELWLGRNAIGVVAAGLMFLGIAYFAVALIPQLADEAKVAIMFALSIAATALGSLLALRKQNGFTTALMGCGAGSLFISVLATHLYFGLLPEAPALLLVLTWMVLCLLLVRKTQSLLLDIVFQLGLAVSVCLAFSSGFSRGLDDGRVWLLVGYQLTASVIVVGGNLMFYPKMYRSSLLLALGLSLVTSLFIAEYCWPFTLFGLPTAERPVAFAALVFTLQFASATAFAAMLAHAVLRAPITGPQPNPAEQAEGKGARKHPTSALVAATVLWLLATLLDVAHPMARCLDQLNVGNPAGSDAHAIGIACQLVVIAAACAALIVHVRTRKMRLDQAPASTALRLLVCGGSLVAAFGSINAYDFVVSLPLGYLWIWALFAMVLAHKVNDQRHAVVALVCLVIESWLASVGLFPELTLRLGMGFALGYGAVYVSVLCALMGWLLHQQGWHRNGTVLLAAVGTMLVMSYFAHCTPLTFEPWVWSISFMTCALIWVVLGFAMNHSQLRLCGLVVVLCCVAKLVVFDLAGLDPTPHTVAYIGGGLICFVVSALYNFATRRITTKPCA